MLEGIVESIVFRNEENGFTVMEVNTGEDYVIAVGSIPLIAKANGSRAGRLGFPSLLRQTIKSYFLRNSYPL
jgi:hypothetical protein